MLSKNKRILNKKTRRNNIPMDESDQPTTTIKLILLPSKQRYNRLNDYSSIKFSFTDKISLANLIQKKIQLIDLDINSNNKIYIIDRIELTNENGSKIGLFIMPIYINKINTCYIDLKYKDNKGYFFEFIFYSKNKNNLPQYLLNQNNEKLDAFDTYNLKYRKKINIINAEYNIATKYINKMCLESYSNKICIRINDFGKMLTSVHIIRLEEKSVTKTNQIKGNKNDIAMINDLFEDFKKTKSLELINKKYKRLNDAKVFKQFIKSYIYANKDYLEIPNITSNDIDILKEYLLKLIIQYFFINPKESKKTSEELLEFYKNDILTTINNIQSIIKDIEEFAETQENSIILKFRLYRATINNIYTVIKKYSSDKIVTIEMLSTYKQKIMNIKNSSQSNPYNKAIKFLKEIAENLNEDSYLFDVLFQYNCDISEDTVKLQKKDKNETVFLNHELSMLTVKEVTNHLKSILPDFIVRYTGPDETFAFYAFLNDIIFVNEQKSFNKNEIINFDGKSQYIVPIVILFLHECWGHKKVYSSTKFRKDSPSRNYFRGENFEEQILETHSKDSTIKGESGLQLEYLIAGKLNKAIVSKYLLTPCNTHNSSILNSKLWVQPDFGKLQQIIRNNYQRIYNVDISAYSKNREEEENEIKDRYGLKCFFEDGVKIGPFFKP